MKGHVIQLHGGSHREVLALLPWLVTGQLDPADAGRVEAHLESCAACRAALIQERRLEREIVRLPAGVDDAWADMRQRLDLDHTAAMAPQGRGEQPVRRPEDGAHWPGWLRWPSAWRLVPPLAFASLVATLFLPLQLPARFTALGTSSTSASGNMVVIFRPDTSEALFRQTLRASEGRLIDGPTAANAYVIAVPAEDRTATLDRLRHLPQVVLAEPIDSGRAP